VRFANFTDNVRGGIPAQIVFSQGEVADAVFYIQQGKIKLTVVSRKRRRIPRTIGTLLRRRASGIFRPAQSIARL
jgi:hypothetical protein